MSDSNKFGYVGYQNNPEQSFTSSAGVFSVNEIYGLVREDKFPTYGQLELIQSQSITSATTYMTFSNLTNDYSVHLLTLNSITSDGSNPSLRFQLSDDNGSTYATSGYHYAGQYNDEGTNGQSRTTASDAFYPLVNVSGLTNGAGNCFIYLYDFLDNAKYSYISWHSASVTGSGATANRSWFGSGTLPTTTSHNAFRLYFNNSADITNLQASLYGIREYS